jgi:4-diphosphocytidyl-2-C-methyl-D-erythritol kinase
VDSEIAYAKINVALHVRRRRADGYHDIETIFAFCADGDRIEAEPADRLSLTIDGPFAAGLSTTDNLVTRAAQILGPGRGAAIRLTKNLPVASGIGGGSADAAATLRLLRCMWAIAISDSDLHALAASLGADVPACLKSEPAWGRDRGDWLEQPRDNDRSGTAVLLVNPGVPLGTAAVFAEWDGIDRGPVDFERGFGRNDLEAPAIRLVPEISDVLTALGKSGAMFRQMSGSGATCFALYRTDAMRDAAARTIAAAYPGWWQMASTLR